MNATHPETRSRATALRGTDPPPAADDPATGLRIEASNGFARVFHPRAHYKRLVQNALARGVRPRFGFERFLYELGEELRRRNPAGSFEVIVRVGSEGELRFSGHVLTPTSGGRGLTIVTSPDGRPASTTVRPPARDGWEALLLSTQEGLVTGPRPPTGDSPSLAAILTLLAQDGHGVQRQSLGTVNLDKTTEGVVIGGALTLAPVGKLNGTRLRAPDRNHVARHLTETLSTVLGGRHPLGRNWVVECALF